MRWFTHQLLPLVPLALVLMPPAAGAQVPCHLFSSATRVPEGFGAAFNLFSSARETMLNVDCSSAPNVPVAVGNGDDTVYIYKTGYEWTGGAWRPFSFSGSRLATDDWYIGYAEANLVGSQTEHNEQNYFLAYTCVRTRMRWKCGCRNAACAANYWQLQGFKYPGTTGPDHQAACASAVSVANTGATGNGSTDDTSAIENALQNNSVVKLDSGKTYIVDNLTIPSDKILCGYGATLQLKPFNTITGVFYHNVLMLTADNISLYGMTIDGNRDNHNFNWNDTDGKFQNGGANAIASFGASNVIIRDVTAKNAVTDGLLFGTGSSRPQLINPGKVSNNWMVSNFIADNNGRQGMTIGHGVNIVFEDCAFINTNGRLPGAGVDIEPDQVWMGGIKGLRFSRCRFTGNATTGITNDNRAGLEDFVLEDSVFKDHGYRDFILGGREGAGSDRAIIRRNDLQKEIVISSTGSNAPPAPHKELLVEKNTVGSNIRANNITSDSSVTVRNNCIGGSVTGFPSGTLTQSNNNANGCK